MNKYAMFFLMALATWPGIDVAMASDSAEMKPVVLITGANRGLGLEFAKQYVEAGWEVIGTARKPDSASDLKDTGARVMQLDVVDADSVAKLAAALKGQPIDLLINNAGILVNQNALSESDLDAAGRQLDVNVLGPMRVTQSLLPNLEAGQKKIIVNISSGLGSIAGNESGGFYGYRESKAALNMFTRSLSAELGDKGFIAVAMDPGWVQTDMGGSSAPLTPEQSISGIRAVIDGLTAEDSGTYLRHDGENVAW